MKLIQAWTCSYFYNWELCWLKKIFHMWIQKLVLVGYILHSECYKLIQFQTTLSHFFIFQWISPFFSIFCNSVISHSSSPHNGNLFLWTSLVCLSGCHSQVMMTKVWEGVEDLGTTRVFDIVGMRYMYFKTEYCTKTCWWYHVSIWNCLSLWSEKNSLHLLMVLLSRLFGLKFTMQGIFVHSLYLMWVWWIFGGRCFLVCFLGDIWSVLFVHECLSFSGKKSHSASLERGLRIWLCPFCEG